MTTTTTDHSGGRSDEDVHLASRTAEPVWPPAPEPRQWRFVSAVHAARALNARPA